MIVGHLIVRFCMNDAYTWNLTESFSYLIACQIDFFVLSYVDYLWLELDDEVSIKYADCQLKNYITKQHLSLVKASSNEKIIPSLLTDQYKI